MTFSEFITEYKTRLGCSYKDISDATGLTPATAYTFYVISDRGSNGTSVIASTEFTTSCGVISTIPWNYGFENCTSNVTPLCWNELKNSTAYVRARSGSSYRKTGNFGLCLYGGGSTRSVIAVFPEFEEDINNLAVRFWYKATPDITTEGWETYYGKPQFGYITDIEDSTTFVAVTTLSQSGSFIQTEQLSVNTETVGARFAIRYSGGSSDEYMYIDDITVSEKPAC